MPRIPHRSALVALAVLLVAVPAAAEVFHVTLKNGTTFDTRYQPQQASWDPNQIVFLTDVGNWIALGSDEVASVQSEIEVKGFGRVINTTTIELGMAPNDLPGEEGETDPQQQFLALMRQQVEAQQQVPANYSMPLVTRIGATGGIPLGFTANTTPPVSSPSSSLFPSPPPNPEQ